MADQIAISSQSSGIKSKPKGVSENPPISPIKPHSLLVLQGTIEAHVKF